MHASKPLALIASPDAVTAVLSETALETHFFQTAIVFDGFDAADVALLRRPSLVVLHRLLPGLDAMSLCRLLKARRATDKIPIVVLTPYATPAERDAVLDAGADQVLVEPCAPELLAIEAARLVAQMASIRAAEHVVGYSRRSTDQHVAAGE